MSYKGYCLTIIELISFALEIAKIPCIEEQKKLKPEDSLMPHLHPENPIFHSSAVGQIVWKTYPAVSRGDITPFT